MDNGPIQTLPLGLLGLLDLKTMGRNPPALGQTVAPVLDITQLYLNGKALEFAATSKAVGVGGYGLFLDFDTTVPITVPEGETWFVHDYTMLAQLNAGGTCNLVVPAWRPAGGNYHSLANEKDPMPVGGNSMFSVRDFWLPPGASLGFWVHTVGVATLNVYSQGMRYTPCQV
jgi:hypothetical protein